MRIGGLGAQSGTSAGSDVLCGRRPVGGILAGPGASARAAGPLCINSLRNVIVWPSVAAAVSTLRGRAGEAHGTTVGSWMTRLLPPAPLRRGSVRLLPPVTLVRGMVEGTRTCGLPLGSVGAGTRPIPVERGWLRVRVAEDGRRWIPLLPFLRGRVSDPLMTTRAPALVPRRPPLHCAKSAGSLQARWKERSAFRTPKLRTPPRILCHRPWRDLLPLLRRREYL